MGSRAVWHTSFIVLHASAATVSLVAGLIALPAGRCFALYRWSLAAMVVFLAPALVIDWPGLDPIVQVIFAALLGLGAVMFWRASRAGAMLPATTGGPTPTYLDHVGFTLISLAVGFVAVAVLRAGAPGGLVAGSAAAVVVVGHLARRVAKARLVQPQPPAIAA